MVCALDLVAGLTAFVLSNATMSHVAAVPASQDRID